jgi:uncharacterized protein
MILADMKILCTTFAFIILSAIPHSVLSQELPALPNPPRLVNDFTGTLAPNEIETLESALVSFNDSTSTQITVVFINDLGNYTANQFAFEIGSKWGVGQKGKSNGIIVLVKPKAPGSKGQAAISVGYGLEDVVTDALCKRIIEVEMKPHFIENDYFGGIVAATKVIMDVTKGRYTAEQYTKKNAKKPSAIAGFVFFCMVLVIIIAVAGNKNRSQHHSIGRAGSNIPFWLIMGSLLGSSNRSGSGGGWSDFSSGSGGFGGFGGGSFGGGGASGSW